MKKALKYILLLSVLLMCLWAASAHAADLSGTNWSYTGTVLTITGNMSDYRLASSKSDWFIGTPFERNGIDNEVTEIVVEEGVTKLGNMIFYGFNNLQKVTLPSTLTTIGSYTFYYAPNLKEITIPASVTSIGHAAFMNCRGLTKITFKGDAPSYDQWDAYYDFKNPNTVIFTGCTADVYHKPYAGWTDHTISVYSKDATMTWHTEAPLMSGNCGDNMVWKLLDDGTLGVSSPLG